MKNRKIIHSIMAEYKFKRESAARAADAQLSRALENPAYFKITKEISSLNFTIAEKTVRGLDVSADNNRLENLEKERISALKKMKMSDADFTPKYVCPLCHDEGLIEGKYCDCFKKRYYEVLKEVLSINTILPCTFENVDFSKISDKKLSTLLKNNYSAFQKYAVRYPSVKRLNALIMGGTGVGKSYLMSAVANKLSERGFSVIYVTAIQLDKLMLNYHTAPAAERDIYLEDILDCDMLIIDDLGSEQKIRNVTEEYLLQILNTREMHSKPVFITTNLSKEALKASYNERLFSRIANIKTTIITTIEGVDLRLN